MPSGDAPRESTGLKDDQPADRKRLPSLRASRKPPGGKPKPARRSPRLVCRGGVMPSSETPRKGVIKGTGPRQAPPPPPGLR